VLGGFALVFVVLAFSMFGFYELQLPTALQSRLSDTANHQGGSPGGVMRWARCRR
jgi:thiol:disulfide interchange protein DsbD